MMNTLFLGNIIKFLSNFNIGFSDQLNEKEICIMLRRKDRLTLYDDCMSPVGQIYVFNRDVYINAFLDGVKLKCKATCNDDKAYKEKYTFDYKLLKNEIDYIKGLQTVKGVCKDKDYVADNKLDLYLNDKLIIESSFYTNKNKFDIDFYGNIEKISYKSNVFKHSNFEKSLEIRYNFGEIEYEVIYDNSEDYIFGYDYVEKRTIKEDENYEERFGVILRNIDEDYFTKLEEIKELYNSFSNRLFERTSCMSLKHLNKSKLESLLNIDFGVKKEYVKEKKKD